MRYRLLLPELLFVFIGLPTVLAALHVHRPILYLSLWVMALFGAWSLHRNHTVTWNTLWYGVGWSTAQKSAACLRFVGTTLATAALLYYFFPQYLLSFPRQKPMLWAMVMVMYPLLSVMAQEFVFRSFFLRRYAPLFPQVWLLYAANVFCFGFLHIVLHNWIAPLVSAFGGLIFAYGYHQHQSLQWAAIEHAAYGCMIFTLGLGYFFFSGFHP